MEDTAEKLALKDYKLTHVQLDVVVSVVHLSFHVRFHGSDSKYRDLLQDFALAWTALKSLRDADEFHGDVT